MSFVRSASQVSRVGARVPATRATPVVWTAQRAFSQSAARKSDAHAEETFEEFTARYDASVEGLGRKAGEGATRG
jgi:cytochrome c oxidase subunit 5a